MAARSPDEEGRTATTLELFFDLVFVVAVAFAADDLHHGLSEGAVGESIGRYLQVFFAIWWAWMNFTWFASAYDNDDVPYRLTIFVGIAGALTLAAGVPEAFGEGDFAVVTIGYVIMRMALVSLWIRAGRVDAPRRRTARRFAAGVTVVQIGWISLLIVPGPMTLVGFLFLVACELAVPIWAESAAPTTWHPEHITERYGLFTIIVLGESILASSLAIQTVMSEIGDDLDLILVVGGGLVTVCAMWWLYFDKSGDTLLTGLRRAFVWGYGHYLVWSSAAAVGAGLAVTIDDMVMSGQPSDLLTGMAFAVPVATYLMTVWILHYRSQPEGSLTRVITPVAAVLTLLSPLSGRAVPLTGLILALLLTGKLVATHRPVTVAR